MLEKELPSTTPNQDTSQNVEPYSPELSRSLKEIKQKLWLRMDGVTAASLRESEASYSLTLGLSIPHLREIAAQYSPQLELAKALLEHQMRELKLLGVMLFPVEALTDVSLAWILERSFSAEIRDHVAFHLLAEVASFDEMVESLLAKLSSEDLLPLLLAASSRRLVKGSPLKEATIRILLRQLLASPLSPQAIHFLYHLESLPEVKVDLVQLLKEWKESTDERKRAFAADCLLSLESESE